MQSREAATYLLISLSKSLSPREGEADSLSLFPLWEETSIEETRRGEEDWGVGLNFSASWAGEGSLLGLGRKFSFCGRFESRVIGSSARVVDIAERWWIENFYNGDCRDYYWNAKNLTNF